MHREKGKLKARAEFVQRVVKNAPKKAKAIERLASRLFLSEESIMKDLRKDTKRMR